MAEQNVRITVTAEDRASGPIKNVNSALGTLEKGTSKVGSALSGLASSAVSVAEIMASNFAMEVVSAISSVTKEIMELAVEQSKLETQTKSLFKNTGLLKYSGAIEEVIEQHEEMTSIDDASLRRAYNNIFGATKDYSRSLTLLSAAEDFAAAKGITLEAASNQITSALEGNISTLSKAGVELDSVRMKSMTAAQQMEYLAVQIEKSFGGAASEYAKSPAGIYSNFQNQIQDLKKLFGDELIESLSPAWDSIAAKISSLIDSGKLQPLVDAFGNLVTNTIEFGETLANIIIKLTGVTTAEEGITRLADSFDRVSYILGIIEDALSRINAIIKDLKLDKIMAMGLNLSTPGTMQLWDYAGKQVEYERAGAYTPYEAAARGKLVPPVENTTPIPQTSESASDALSRLREGIRTENENQKSKKDNSQAVENNTQNVLSATDLLRIYKDQTSKTGTEVDKLGRASGSAISYMNSAMSKVGQMLNPSGGGGGGCRTYGTGTTIEGGGSYRSGAYSGGPSGSPGILWYNVLGNENAAAVSAMGESWASTVSNVTRNSCSGQVCSFDADGQTFYGDGSGSFTSVNDALITNKGEVIQFHPDDNILAFKDSSKLRGKGIVINNTFNINGSGDPDRIADEIMKKITRVGRIGF